MSFFMLLSVLIIITLNSLSDKLFTSISFSVLLENFLVLSFGACFFVFAFWPPLCISFYVLGRPAKILGQTFVIHCLRLALGNLFGAIIDPQLLAPSAGPLCVQKA